VKQKRALITGITGQDGSYLAELLLCKGYEVHGLIRRSSTTGTSRIDHLLHEGDSCEERLQLHYADLCDANSLRRVLDKTQPQEIYNLAAQSHVRVSFDTPIDTADINALGTLRLLDAIREIEDQIGQQVKFYQASSSEMFGKVCEVPQTEKTPFYPRSPYAIAKTFAYWATVNYREAYGLHASNGILFNHESPRRGENFVTRKITRAIGRIKYGLQDRLTLGNLDAQRDWGFTGDYVVAMWQMLQQEQADDFVIATGETHSVREFLELAFGVAGLDHTDFVDIDPRFFRPTEVDLLLGDASKARKNLQWQPKVDFEELVRIMVEADLELAVREKTLRSAGQTEPVKTLRRAA